jgi:hypothetical protein
MSASSKFILGKVDKVTMEIFPKVEKLAFEITSESLSELGEIQDIPRLGAFNRKFNVMTAEETKYRENLVRLIPDKFALSYTSLFLRGEHPLKAPRARSSKWKKDCDARPEWLDPRVAERASLRRTELNGDAAE